MADFVANRPIKSDEVSKLNHADADGSHGIASTTQYGHVKLVNSATSSVEGAVPSSTAVATKINDMDSKINTNTNNITNVSNKVDGITLASLGGAPAYTYGTADLTAGTSALATGTLYFVYE